MKNEHNHNGTAPAQSQENQGTEGGIVEILKSIEKHLVRGNGLSQAIIKKLNSIDESVNVFAAQKSRELNSDGSGDAEKAA